ncbi:MAG TPA: hypothetical protein VLG71_02265 [Candidatus Limnocylindria bacterium]|nr:hypothetical protein [Candidatus Limnocylindria bacterium]
MKQPFLQAIIITLLVAIIYGLTYYYPDKTTWCGIGIMVVAVICLIPYMRLRGAGWASPLFFYDPIILTKKPQPNILFGLYYSAIYLFGLWLVWHGYTTGS